MDSGVGASYVFTLFKYVPYLYLVSSIVLTVWVVMDCGITGQDAAIWGPIVFIFNIAGLVFYYVATRINWGGPVKRKDLVLRDKDDELRRKYTGGGDGMAPVAHQIPPGPASPADQPDFVIDDLETMLKKGNLSGAREYINEMRGIANEVNDRRALQNLKKYESKVAREAVNRMPQR